MTERELVDGFERCTLPNHAFHHAAPCRSCGRCSARCRCSTRCSDSWRRSSASPRITFAYVLLVHERMQRSAAESWDEFAAENPDLLTWRPSILDRYYDAATLLSDFARHVLVFPTQDRDSRA